MYTPPGVPVSMMVHPPPTLPGSRVREDTDAVEAHLTE